MVKRLTAIHCNLPMPLVVEGGPDRIADDWEAAVREGRMLFVTHTDGTSAYINPAAVVAMCLVPNPKEEIVTPRPTLVLP